MATKRASAMKSGKVTSSARKSALSSALHKQGKVVRIPPAQRSK